MNEIFERQSMLLGKKALGILQKKSVAVFGIGGVGSFAAEAIARAGVQKITLIDGDTVVKSNINRQLIALHSTIGMPKTEVMKNRIKDINPNCEVTAHHLFYSKDTPLDINGFDYIIDAIDTVTSKLFLIENAYNQNIKIISSMGAGNKLDPTLFEIADIKKTSVCPLARVMRRELKTRGIETLKVVYSKEPLIIIRNSDCSLPDGFSKKHDKIRHRAVIFGIRNERVPGSVSFVPPVVGMILAGEVIKDLIK